MSDFVQDALGKANKCHDYWQPIFDKGREDLRFQSDVPYSQWEQNDVQARIKAGKPVLQNDQLAQFVNQVSNDIRMNTPSIDIIPSSGGASQEMADIYQGLIKNIENKSNADEAYDNAVNFAIKCGLGYIRVDHDYQDEMSFDQELYIERVVNPFSVLYDYESTATDGSDAKYCYILETMSLETYREKYPKASEVSFAIDDSVKNDTSDQEEITLAEYFYIDEQEITIIQDGDEVRILQEGEEVPEGIQTRKSKSRIVRRCKMNGEEKLEETTFPGDYIPVVPVYGEEAWEDGKRNLLSLIRRSKDPQRMFNYWTSTEAQLLINAPKGAWKAAEGQTEDYADDYINPDKTSVYRYKQKDSSGMPAPAPEYVPPPQVPIGIVTARQQTTMDIRATMGLYDSFLGQQDNAVSGVAIGNRQREGDRAVFHFGDNLVRSITQVGRILVSAIPTIYDTPRVVRIIGKEDTNEEVGINGMYVEGQKQNYSLGEGRYNVKVTTGATYATMRQEASQAYQQIVAAQPQLMSVMGDLLFKYMDFPGAQSLSERMKRTIDPKIIDDEQDPQVMAMQAQNQELQHGIEMLQGQLGQMQQQLQDKQAEIQIKAQAEQSDAVNDARKHELELEKLRLEERNKIAEINLKQQELELKAYDLGLKTSKQATEQSREALKGVVELTTDISEERVND